MSEALAVQQRVVPGAPPPSPLTKTQKRRRKTKAKGGEENGTDGNNIDRVDSPATSVPDASAAALIDKAPDTVDVQKGLLAPDLVTQPEPQTPTIPEELKPNTISGLVNKRLKATTKKIAKATAYAATDLEKLDDDQKRILKTLPTLEAIQKELSEVKKAVEVYETDLAIEFGAQKLEAEKAEKARIAEAVATFQNESVQKIADILDLLRLRSLLAAGEVDTLSVEEHESSTLFTVADMLLSNDQDKRSSLIRSLLVGSEGFNGISYTRLTEITQLGLASPRAPTPVTEPVVEQPEAEDELETAPTVAVDGAPAVAPVSKGFSFVQESEIEETQPADDDGWVDATVVPETQAPEDELTNGHVQQEDPTELQALETATVFAEPPTSAPLDWATDDTDLPPIADVQESIGASGSATPAEGQPKTTGDENAGENDPSNNRRPEEDRFAHSRGGRGRGRGFRGERGGYRNRGERGGFRGERGNFRGGERGGFRGERGPHGSERGGFHGSERGEHSGYRGGERGESQGGERGEFRGGERGEFRGGERGEFRGGERSEFRGGDRGEFRGGERGEFRGGERGEYRGGYRGRGENREGGRGGGYRGRGEWRGDGEHRARRGGRGRGPGGDRGGAEAATTSAAEPTT